MSADLLEHETKPRIDAARLNALVNHPEVRPTCGGDGKSYLDVSPILADDRNRVFTWEHGSFLFTWTAPQTYMVDIAVLPEGRGREAYAMAKSGISYIVSEGAERLWALISPEMKGLRHFAVQAGFEPCRETADIDLGFGPVTYQIYQWKKPCLKQ